MLLEGGQGLYRRLIILGRFHFLRGRMSHVLHCPECGTDKLVKDLSQIYCSQPCAKAAQRKLRTGSEYRKWKQKVLERDNYTCQMCGATMGKIIAHHIVGLSDVPELRLELSNGQALCLICHDIIHGTTGNTLFRGVFGNRLGRKI